MNGEASFWPSIDGTLRLTAQKPFKPDVVLEPRVVWLVFYSRKPEVSLENSDLPGHRKPLAPRRYPRR